MFIRGRILAGIAVATAIWAATVRARQLPPPPQKEKGENRLDEKPAVVSADALKLGAEFESAASGDSLKWARDFAKREIAGRSATPEDEAVTKAVAARWPKAPAAAQEAGIYLVWYAAYQQATKSQDIAAGRLRDMDRDLRNIEDELLRIRTTPVPLSQMAAARAAEDRVEGRLQDAARLRDFHKGILDGIRARVDVCLERLAARYEGLKDGDPAAIRALK